MATVLFARRLYKISQIKPNVMSRIRRRDVENCPEVRHFTKYENTKGVNVNVPKLVIPFDEKLLRLLATVSRQ